MVKSLSPVETQVILCDGRSVPAVFELDYGVPHDEIFYIRLRYQKGKIDANGQTFWEALLHLRMELENQNTFVGCFGSCENVYQR